MLKCKGISTAFMLQDNSLKQVCESVYLVVILINNQASTSDVERSKLIFFKQQNSVNIKFSCVVTKVLIYLFRMHEMSFYDIETWFLNLHTKYWTLNQLHIIKQLNASVVVIPLKTVMNVVSTLDYKLSSTFLQGILFYLLKGVSTQKAHVLSPIGITWDIVLCSNIAMRDSLTKTIN